MVTCSILKAHYHPLITWRNSTNVGNVSSFLLFRSCTFDDVRGSWGKTCWTNLCSSEWNGHDVGRFVINYSWREGPEGRLYKCWLCIVTSSIVILFEGSWSSFDDVRGLEGRQVEQISAPLSEMAMMLEGSWSITHDVRVPRECCNNRWISLLVGWGLYTSNENDKKKRNIFCLPEWNRYGVE